MPDKSQIIKQLEAAQAGYKETDCIPLSGSLLYDIVQMVKGKAEQCEYCKVLTEEHKNGFMLPSTDPDCECDFVTITHCPMCGRKL